MPIQIYCLQIFRSYHYLHIPILLLCVCVCVCEYAPKNYYEGDKTGNEENSQEITNFNACSPAVRGNERTLCNQG